MLDYISTAGSHHTKGEGISLTSNNYENLPLTLVSLGGADSGGFSAIHTPEMPAGLITVFGRAGDRADWLLEGAR